jgi:hypothetical protein
MVQSCCSAILSIVLLLLLCHVLTVVVSIYHILLFSMLYAAGQAPVDLLLLMACSENDTPKVEELLRAGANPTVTDLGGLTPLQLCTKEEIKDMLEAALAKRG